MHHAREEQRGRAARTALFALVWFAATFFYLGDLGKWMDDWEFHARNVATGEIRWDRLLALDPLNARFWRPFHIHAGMAVQTFFWRHDWATHLLLALLHGVNAWTLWRILGRLCVTPQAAAFGALVFLVCPAGHEAIFWNSTIGTSAGVWWLLLCILAVQRYAAGEIGRRALLLYAPLLLTLAWWYEQAAACAPVVGAAYLACAPTTLPPRQRYGRAMAIATAAVFGGALYVALMVGLSNPHARVGAQSIVNAGELLPQARAALSQAWDHLTLAHFVPGALAGGWRALRSRPAESIAVAAGIAAALTAFSRWWMRSPGGTCSPADPSIEVPPRRRWGAVMGLGIAACAMAPVIAVRGQAFETRLAYTPALGIVSVLAVALDVLLASAWIRRRAVLHPVVRACSLGVLACCLSLGVVMMLGVQAVWHARAVNDRRVAAALRRALPSPPERALIVPVQLTPALARTGSGAFDAIGTGPFEFPWSADNFVRSAYGRADLYAVAMQSWLPPGHQLTSVAGGSEDGLVLDHRVRRRVKPASGGSERELVPWNEAVPIRVLKGGHVALAHAWQIDGEADPAAETTIPVPAALGAGAIASPSGEWIVHLPAAPPSPGEPALQRPSWSLGGTGGRTPFDQASPTPRSARGRVHNAFLLHPAVESIEDRSMLKVDLQPHDRARVLKLRAALLDHTQGLSDGVDVSVELAPDRAGGASMVLASDRVTHARLAGEPGWVAIRATIPPLAEARECRIVVGPGTAGNPNADWCLVTPPVLAEASDR